MRIRERIHNIIDKGDNTGKSMVINTMLRPLSMVLSFIYTPLLLKFLGDEKYGIWTTLLSVITWINYCDIGIGHGLRNLLTKELTEQRKDEAKKSISTAYIVLTIIAVIVWILLVASVYFLDWNNLLGTNLPVDATLYITFTFICINFVLALCNTVFYALQMSEKVSIRNIMVQSLNIIGVVLLGHFGRGNLPEMAVLFGGTTCFVYILNTISIYRNNPFLRPGLWAFDKKKVSQISGIGIKFFVIQIAGIFLYSVDNILISKYFGAEAVTPFNTVYKVYNTVASVYLALIVPIWSRTTVAVAKGDSAWIRNTVKKLNKLLIPFFLGFVILIFVYKPLANIWLGKNLDYQKGIIFINAAYFIVYLVGSLYAYVLNGIGSVNYQLILNVAEAIINIPLSIYFAVNCGMGVFGIKLATTILVTISAVTLPINLRVVLKKIDGGK